MSGKRTPPDWSWIRGCEFYDLSVLDDGSRGYEWLAYWRTKHASRRRSAVSGASTSSPSSSTAVRALPSTVSGSKAETERSLPPRRGEGDRGARTGRGDRRATAASARRDAKS